MLPGDRGAPHAGGRRGSSKRVVPGSDELGAMQPVRVESVKIARMALTVVRGDTGNAAVADLIIQQMRKTVADGTVYVGYPVLAGVDGRIPVDVLLVSPQLGLVAVSIANSAPANTAGWDELVEAQDAMFAALESHLSRYPALRLGRRFIVPITTFTVVPPATPDAPTDTDAVFVQADEIADRLPASGIDAPVYTALESALQRVTTIKPIRKREAVTKESSRGGVLKAIEKEIANLDQWQKQAAIESPDGPQRIRGLAGSGKTIVLALKAAYWHVQHPDWTIAMTFQTRALYQQLIDLANRFTFAHGEDTVDPDHLQIMHAWGSTRREGVYQQMASSVGLPARDFNYARARFGMDQAFRGVCKELLAHCAENPPEPIYDAVIIDEAQDLPAEFFQLVWLFTKPPHRVVWAYDELQILSESTMPSMSEMFGQDESGRPLVELRNDPDRARQDVMLPVCYRNTPWALTVAHALGFGVYRDEGLVQHFDNPELWRDIGYEDIGGTLALGEHVVLRRGKENSPRFFHALLSPADAVVSRQFDSTGAQDQWIATEIRRNLEVDELEAEDILIVLPNTITAKSRFAQLRAALQEEGLECHMPGFTTNPDSVFEPGSIAITHIFRAKGNEAAMVYVADCEYATGGTNKVTRRNTIFTAITRSRAWVRTTGVGDNFAALNAEIGKVVGSEWKLDFTIPTLQQLQHLRTVNRERSKDQEAQADKVLSEFERILQRITDGDLTVADLTPRQKTLLARFTDGSAGVEEYPYA